MTRAGRAYAAAVGTLVLALAAACGTTAVPAAPRTPAPVQASWPGCEAVGAFVDDRGQGPAGVGDVPAGFVPSSVVLCDEGGRSTSHGAEQVELERTSTDVAPLVTYLSQPDGAPTQDACTADGWLRPWLYLVAADGSYVAPAIPVDGCGKPLGWSSRDHAALAWTALRYTDRVLGPAKSASPS